MKVISEYEYYSINYNDDKTITLLDKHNNLETFKNLKEFILSLKNNNFELKIDSKIKDEYITLLFLNNLNDNDFFKDLFILLKTNLKNEINELKILSDENLVLIWCLEFIFLNSSQKIIFKSFSLLLRNKTDLYERIEIIKEINENKIFLFSHTPGNYAKNYILNKFKKGYNYYRFLYPKISDEEERFFLNYFTQPLLFIQEKYLNKELKNVYQLDFNQFYPSLYYFQNFPILLGEKITKEQFINKKDNDDSIYFLKIRIINFNSKTSLFEDEELIRSRILYLSDQDLYFLKEYYQKFEYEILEGFKYESSRVRFRDKILYFYNKRLYFKDKNKKISDFYKYCNNTIYGKISQHKQFEKFEVIYKNGKIFTKFKNEKGNKSKFCYLPVGRFTLSLARRILFEKIIMQFDFNDIVGANTDCVYIIETNKNKKQLEKIKDSNELGELKKKLYKKILFKNVRDKIIYSEEN